MPAAVPRRSSPAPNSCRFPRNEIDRNADTPRNENITKPDGALGVLRPHYGQADRASGLRLADVEGEQGDRPFARTVGGC